MTDFNRKQEDMIPLKWKVGDRVMGIASGAYKKAFPIAGTIISVYQSMSHLTSNGYEIRLEEGSEVPKGLRQDGVYYLTEGNVMSYDRGLWAIALSRYSAYLALIDEANATYNRMLQIFAE